MHVRFWPLLATSPVVSFRPLLSCSFPPPRQFPAFVPSDLVSPVGRAAPRVMLSLSPPNNQHDMLLRRPRHVSVVVPASKKQPSTCTCLSPGDPPDPACSATLDPGPLGHQISRRIFPISMRHITSPPHQPLHVCALRMAVVAQPSVNGKQ